MIDPPQKPMCNGEPSAGLLSNDLFLRRLLAASPDCIKVLDLEARLLEMSENGLRALEITDITPHLGTCWTAWWRGPSSKSAEQAVAAAQAGGTGRFEAQADTFGGTPKWWDVTVTAIPGPDGRPERLLSVSRDITDRKRAELERQRLFESERAARAEAERAVRIKDDFLATLSHELRTPLNAILGWTQILMGSDSRDDLGEGLAVIDRNARAQTHMIEDILDMSRIVSGKLRLDVQQVELAALIQAACDTVRPAAEGKNIKLHVLLDPLGVPVAGDPNRLNQVFWNLLSNAVKFTPKGGRVQVLLQRVNSHIELTVTDTGEGIDPAFLPYVFDRFRQDDASTTRRHGGLGLGLAIVKQLVEMHGGSVGVRSPGKGHGATFVVALPLAVVHPDADNPAAAREHPTHEISLHDRPMARDHLRGVRVLVVDDEADAQAVIKRLLEDCGAIVETAASVDEAWACFQSQQPTVLVTDIGMPGKDGYELIRMIRSTPKDGGGQIHAVALTAYARAADRVRALEAGFQMHLSKPIEAAELIATISSLAKMAKQTGAMG